MSQLCAKRCKTNSLGIWVRVQLEGKPFKISIDGLQLRDFNHVDDCVETLLLMGASNATIGKIYNPTSTEALGLNVLAEMMVDLGYGGAFELNTF